MNTNSETESHTPENLTNSVSNNDFCPNAGPSITQLHNIMVPQANSSRNNNSLHSSSQPNIEITTHINIQQLLQTPTPSITSPQPNNEPIAPAMLDFTDRLLHLNWNSSETMEIDLSSVNNLRSNSHDFCKMLVTNSCS